MTLPNFNMFYHFFLQALLQVARHLFTNLGELNICPSKGFDNFPWIRSRMCEVNSYGTSAIKSVKRDRYVPFCNCQIVAHDGFEWQHPFRCGLEADWENMHCPKDLKILALECLKLHIDQNKTAFENAVKGCSSKNEDAVDSEQSIATESSNVEDKMHVYNFENDLGKKDVTGSSKEIPAISKKTTKSPEKKSKSPKTGGTQSPKSPLKRFFAGWMFYGSKETDESDSEQDTLVEDTNSCYEIQLSPGSAKSESQISCVSYHTAHSFDSENDIASDYDQEREPDETFYDACGVLNSQDKLKIAYNDYLASQNEKIENRESSCFATATLLNKSSHEIYVEDADTGLGHMILNGSQHEVTQSFSLDEILEADSGFASASSRTDQSNCTVVLHVSTTKPNGSKYQETLQPGKTNTDSGNKEEEVITTVSAVDLTDIQLPETELVPFTLSRSQLFNSHVFRKVV